MVWSSSAHNGSAARTTGSLQVPGWKVGVTVALLVGMAVTVALLIAVTLGVGSGLLVSVWVALGIADALGIAEALAVTVAAGVTILVGETVAGMLVGVRDVPVAGGAVCVGAAGATPGAPTLSSPQPAIARHAMVAVRNN